MKQLFVLLVVLYLLYACKQSSSSNKFHQIIEEYVKQKVKNISSYKSLHFNEPDTIATIKFFDSTKKHLIRTRYEFEIAHTYEIVNENNERVFMSVNFHFDTSGNLDKTSPKGLQGNYGSVEGNVFWKYNNYVSNKPDAGSKIKLYSLDTLRNDLQYDATCDINGNFNFPKVLCGNYIMISQSENTTNSPAEQLQTLLLYNFYLKKAFGYNIFKSDSNAIKNLHVIDSLYDDDEYRQDTARKIINAFPEIVKSNFGLYSLYPNKIDFDIITVEENNVINRVVDFGTTYN